MTKLDFKTCKSEGLNEEQYQANATNNTIINSINNEEVYFFYPIIYHRDLKIFFLN